VFQLVDRSAHARELLRPEEYEDLQNRWDQRGNRIRWSEAFLIVEAWEIKGWPKARDILGPEAARLRCETQSQTLKVLDDGDRAKLADLELSPIDLPAYGLAARHFINLAQRANKERGNQAEALTPSDRGLYDDFGAIEGMTKEMRVRLVLRDRHLVRALKQIGPLKCIICSYDPIKRGATRAQSHAILEAHHKVPIHAGKRLSRLEDLALLCPTCHREVHQGVTTLAA
jgi:5-methylcytosine-specific restriction enzyme A